VFTVGIISFIQGCTQDEGALAFILFLILSLFGAHESEEAACNPFLTDLIQPDADCPLPASATTGVLPVIDQFVQPFNATINCVDAPTVHENVATDTVAFGQRTMELNGIGGDAGTLDIQIGGGKYFVSRTGGPNFRTCAFTLFYPFNGTEGPAFDASSFTAVEFDVSSISGTVTCSLSLDIVRFGATAFFFSFPNMTTTGSKSASFPAHALPLPADSTSVSFQCLLDNDGESITIENLRLT